MPVALGHNIAVTVLVIVAGQRGASHGADACWRLWRPQGFQLIDCRILPVLERPQGWFCPLLILVRDPLVAKCHGRHFATPCTCSLWFLKLFLAARSVYVYIPRMSMESAQAGQTKLTVEGALNRVATIVGFGRNKVWSLTGAMNAVDPDLWPRMPRGRAKPRYPEARHLANLALGLAAMQAETAEIAADRVKAFRMLAQVDGPRLGLTFGEAIDELFDLATRDIGFRRQVWMHQGPIIQLAPTQMAGAEITGGPGGGRYAVTDANPLQVANLMHVRTFGIRSISLIQGSLINLLAELLASFRAIEAALEAKGGVPLPGGTPPITRPTNESDAETPPRTEDRSLSNGDLISCACASAIAQPGGGSLPPGAHHDDPKSPPRRLVP